MKSADDQTKDIRAKILALARQQFTGIMSVTCTVCKKEFKKQFILNRHIRNVHKLPMNSNDRYRTNIKCLEDSCNEEFKFRKQLVEHLSDLHNYTVEQEELEFKTEDDFELWKSNTEVLERCEYIKEQGKQVAEDGTEKVYYVCNRTARLGKEVSSKNIRATKSQGSSKLSHACISSITVLKRTSGVHNIRRIKSHYRHDMELQHIRLSKNDRITVAEKLLVGASKQKILDACRNDIEDDATKLKRMDLLTRQDITNIQKMYNIDIQEGVKHKDDATSVNILVEEYLIDNPEDNPVLLYKKQGEVMAGFDKEDFCLVLMSKYQEYMLKTYGSNIICVDSTHGLNSYDFELTTIMVMDDHGEGFPVATMFTNKKDVAAFQNFFQAVKSKVGVIKSQTFMSDITTIFYDAWCSVMEGVKNQLFCSWHIDHAWRQNLPKISDKEKRNWIYKTVKVLQQDMNFENEEAFKTKLQFAVSLMKADEVTKKFGIYFERNYSNNYKSWAYFFRKHSGINTNNFLESMHKDIKYHYLDGRTVKRLDKGIHAVLKYIRNKMVERVIKNTKGKRTKFIKDIHKRHKTALESEFHIETVDSEQKWSVKGDTATYSVVRESQVHCCNIRCSACNICLHMYSCTCADYYMKTCICKHIHSVILRNALDTVMIPDVSSQKHDDIDLCLSVMNKNCKTATNSSKKDRFSSALASLQQIGSSTDFNNIDNSVLNQVCSLLNKAGDLLKTKTENNCFPETIQSKQPQRKLEKQFSFHSTKQKQNRKPVASKPDNQDIQNVNIMLSGDSTYISTSREYDHNYV